MKKIILGLFLLAAPLMASADEEFTLTLPEQAPAEITDSVALQPEANQYRSFNFGQVRVGQRRVADFVLGAGNFPLRVHGMNVQGRFFDGGSNCPSILFPGQRCVIRVSYWPRQSGNHFGRMTLWVGNDRMVVDMRGRAMGRGGPGGGW